VQGAYWVAYRVHCNSELCSFLAMAMELYELLLTVKLMQPSVVPGIDSAVVFGGNIGWKSYLLDSIFAFK
jgi:hypothetical protein